MNRTYYIVLDTETANGILDGDKLDLSQSMPYDIGWTVCRPDGSPMVERSFVVSEIYDNEAEMMRSAYYADKLPQYEADLASGKRIKRNLYEIRMALQNDVNMFHPRAICAHNARFDYRALNNIERYITKSKYRFFLPYGVDVWDTLQMAQDTIGKQKSYIKWCNDNGYMTKHSVPRPRLTAEILYRYISGDETFEECHTGLEDTQIERQILAHCLRQHKKMRRSIFAEEN